MDFRLALVSLSILLSQQIIAQRDNGAVRLGYGLASFSVESVTTGAVYAEFSKPFTGPVVLAFGGSYASTTQMDDASNSKDLQTFSIRLNAYFQAFKNDWQAINIGAGASGRFFSEDWILDPNRILPSSSFKPGFLLILGYDFFINEQWMIGLTGSGEFFGNDNSVFLIGANAGYRF
ncbi:MAG: hypothetical protein AAFV95_23435 [Bacteroidota bacterium]